MRALLILMLVCFSGGAAEAGICTPDRFVPPALVQEAEARITTIFDTITVPTNSGIYDAQTRGMAPLHVLFASDDTAAQARVRHVVATYLRGLPTSDAVPLRIDGFEVAAAPRRVPVAPDTATLSSGSAMQFAYLISTLLRLSVEADAPKDADLQAIYDFVAQDTLRFYWHEVPAWHWAGAYANQRARTKARFGFMLRLRAAHFRAFLDYDLHVFAMAADLRAVLGRYPDLAGADDLTLADDVLDFAWRALRDRMDGGVSGNGFGFDRGAWRGAIGFEYTGCETADLPNAPCGAPAADHPDVSHAQRWPHWFASFKAGAGARGDTDMVKLITRHRQGLATQIATQALHWQDGRPVLSNFIDGADGWYRFEPVRKGYGHPPSSLTGWALGFGSFARLAPLDPDLTRAHVAFCTTVASDAAPDIAFRTKHYSQNPIAPRPAGQSAQDDYIPGSPALFSCRAYHTLGCF